MKIIEVISRVEHEIAWLEVQLDETDGQVSPFCIEEIENLRDRLQDILDSVEST